MTSTPYIYNGISRRKARRQRRKQTNEVGVDTMTRKTEERIAQGIGWGILAAMGGAIAFGGDRAIGVVSGVSLVAILGYVGYLFRKHPGAFRTK